MNKKIQKKFAVVSLAFGMLFSVSAVPSAVNPTAVTVMAKTTTRTITKKLANKNCYVGLNHGGVVVQTKGWKSSNTSIATVTSSGDSDGGHKVTFKKKGTVTISCTVNKSCGSYKKGDIVKWTIHIK